MATTPKLIIPSNCSPWPQEIRVAKILVAAGYRVRFIPEVNTAKTPDIILNNTLFEIKSPISIKVNAIERNLTNALIKCPNVIFDGSAMKIPDRKIQHELAKRLQLGKGLKRIIFVDKKGAVIDIGSLIK